MADTPNKVQINLQGEGMQEIVSAAILQALSTTERDTLIQSAVQYLLAPPKDTYGRRATTPLQEAFNSALAVRTREFLLEYLQPNSEIWQQIEAVIKEGVEKAVTEGRQELVDKVTTSVRSWMYESGR